MINTEYNKNSNDVAMSLKLELVSGNPKSESNSQATSARKPKGLEGAQTSFAKPKVEYTSNALINQTLSEYSKKTPQELKSALNKFGVTESNYHEIQPVIEHVIKHIEPQLQSFFGKNPGGDGQPSAFQNMLGNVNPFYLINEIMQKSGDNVSLSEISDMQSMNTAQSQFQNQIQGLQGEQTNIENEEAQQSKHHILKDILTVVVITVAAVAVVALATTGIGAVVDAFAVTGEVAADAAEAGEALKGADEAVKGLEDTVKGADDVAEADDDAVKGPDESGPAEMDDDVSEHGPSSNEDSSKSDSKSEEKEAKKVEKNKEELNKIEGEIVEDASQLGDGDGSDKIAKDDSKLEEKTTTDSASSEGADKTSPKASESGFRKYLKSKKFKLMAYTAGPTLGIGIAVGTGLNSYRTSKGNNKITQYQNTASMISTNMQNIQQQSQFQNSNMNNAQQQLSAFASVENAMFKAAAQTSQIQMV